MRSPISSNQTAIATHHPKPDRINLNIKLRSPHITQKPDRKNLNTKLRSQLTTHKCDRKSPHHQTAIATQALNSCKDAVIMKLVMCKSWL
jgi:hypothetical protein